ncbi:MAG: HD domain-containing protein [Eubacteriales bacterium]|nr:HD domain-containing protein [Eubacteriales bacterium]
MKQKIEKKQKRVVVISENQDDCNVLRMLFQSEYDVVECSNGSEGILYIKQHQGEIALMLLDIQVMILEDFHTINWLHTENCIKELPILIITDIDSNGVDEILKRGYSVSDVIVRPFHESIVKQRLHNIIEWYAYKNDLEGVIQQQTYKLNEQNARLMKHNQNMMAVLIDIISFRDMESEPHISYVEGYVRILANKYAELYPKSRMTKKKIEYIVQAARMHDLGKIAMPDRLIRQQGNLLPEEIEYLKEHTLKGSEIVEAMLEFQNDTFRKICYNVCRYHHERYDGTGYPEHLKKDKIPIEAQLVSAADIFDALVNVTTNKDMIPPNKAIVMMLDGGCGELSPRMKECLVASCEELKKYKVENVKDI